MIGAVVKRAVTSRSHSGSKEDPLPPHFREGSHRYLLATCILATPAWVVTHMDDYRGGAVGEV
ncbi:hypothetical protein Ocin01_14941 [Orchesella cincta]|uniref:Uncharacterized protein n=1 Tax=Orchesella cincta TaxID=48709 RepID=A0A1D2MFR1_ORCCI|nr:hypothetical protein Ocin01_14941 [Orchesella cincta]